MTEEVWRRRVVDNVNFTEREKLKKNRQKPPNGGWYDYLPSPRIAPPFNRLLRQAAQARGMSVGSYVRRSVARQIAKDLKMEWTEVIKHSPFPAPFGSKSARPKDKPTIDTGEGYGDWQN